MEFTISRADLVRELSLSQGVVEKRTTIPILSNVLIEASADRVTFTATDLELGIRCSTPAQVKKQGSGTIPAKRLLDYVKLLPDGEVHIKFSDNQWVSITAGRSKTRIAGMSRESFPELPKPGEKVADLPAGSMTAAINQVVFAISTEESRFTLNGALLVLRPDAITLVATDGHRLAMAEREANLTNASARALLPRKAMTELQRLVNESGADSTIAFSATENHLFFQIGERLLISRKLTGNFPDYERVLPKEHAHTIVLDRDDFRAAIERVGQFADERSHAVRLRMEPGELTVHSSLSDTGESEETMAVEYDGPKVEIGFNAHYMLDFIRALPESQLGFYFKDASNAGELQPAGEDVKYKYRYVIMPMRI